MFNVSTLEALLSGCVVLAIVGAIVISVTVLDGLLVFIVSALLWLIGVLVALAGVVVVAYVVGLITILIIRRAL